MKHGKNPAVDAAKTLNALGEALTELERRRVADQINYPEHYTTGEIEVFDFIKDKLTPEELRGYIKGNVLKYISRERHKGGDEDLRKAKWYLDRLCERLEE